MNNTIVKKHNDLIQKARYSLSELEIKIVSNLISIIRTDDTEFQEYHIDINKLQKLTNTKSNDTEYYINIAKSLMSKPFVIDNKVFNWVTSVEYIIGTGVLIFEIHRNLRPLLLELKKNFTQYSISDIMQLKSGYVIRLYELIIAEYNQYMQYNKKAKSYTFELDIQDIIELFEIPKSYSYKDIRVNIIDKAQKQFKEKTNIQFSYEEYKLGRKVVRLKITVKNNLKGSNDPMSDLKSFIQWIRKDFKNVDLFHVTGKQCISCNDDGKLYDKYQKETIDNKRSQEIWTKLYELAKEDKLIALKQLKMNL